MENLSLPNIGDIHKGGRFNEYTDIIWVQCPQCKKCRWAALKELKPTDLCNNCQPCPKHRFTKSACWIIEQSGIDRGDAGHGIDKNWIKSVCQYCPYNMCLLEQEESKL